MINFGDSTGYVNFVLVYQPTPYFLLKTKTVLSLIMVCKE